MAKVYKAKNPHGGHQHRYHGYNRPKDLVGTWKKLLGYCRKYLAVFMIAILCASAGTVLTLIGPDKLSEMTDTITAGITPDTEALKALTSTISENTENNMEEVSAAITANLQSGSPKDISVNGSEISLRLIEQFLHLFAARHLFHVYSGYPSHGFGNEENPEINAYAYEGAYDRIPAKHHKQYQEYRRGSGY